MKLTIAKGIAENDVAEWIHRTKSRIRVIGYGRVLLEWGARTGRNTAWRRGDAPAQSRGALVRCNLGRLGFRGCPQNRAVFAPAVSYPVKSAMG